MRISVGFIVKGCGNGFTLKNAGQNEAADRIKDSCGDEYSCGYTMDPECNTDPAGLFLCMRDISFVEINNVRRKLVPVCQAAIEQVSGDD